MKQNLRCYILTYIGYCLKKDGPLFNYESCSNALNKAGITHEQSTLRKEISLIKSDGLIDHKSYYSKKTPILSTRGKLEIKTRLPFKKYGEWHNNWYMILFAVPNHERTYKELLLKELSNLGFLPLQQDAFVSPYPLLNLIERKANHWGIRQYLKLMIVKELSDLPQLLERWQIDEINSAYGRFLRQLESAKQDEYWPLKAKQFEQVFIEIYDKDPHLPEELLPKDWLGKVAYQAFKKLSNSY